VMEPNNNVNSTLTIKVEPSTTVTNTVDPNTTVDSMLEPNTTVTAVEPKTKVAMAVEADSNITDPVTVMEPNNNVNSTLTIKVEPSTTVTNTVDPNTTVTTVESNTTVAMLEPNTTAAVLEPNTTVDSMLEPNTTVTMFTPDQNDTLPACFIQVSNMELYHYEIIESVAKLMPYEYLDLPDTCNHKDLHFEFNIQSTLGRAEEWINDFNKRVANTSIVDSATGIKRSFGPVAVGRILNGVSDTTIQASCPCTGWMTRWLTNTTSPDSPHMCIYHSYCNRAWKLSNAVYLAPHHKRYFVPSALPQVEAEQKKDTKLDMCTIGSIGRRKWDLVAPFFENPSNEKYFDKIRIRMLGRGGVPKVMKPYVNKTEIVPDQLLDDRSFYAAVKSCGVLLLPIARDESALYLNYFNTPPTSQKKLSGTIPPIIAYEKSFIVPNELLELYHKELPLHVPHRGFDDESDTSFSEAMSSLLETLLT